MNILNVVTKACVDEVSKNVIGYLADAGHQVFLIASHDEEQSFWLAQEHHNIHLINENDISHYKIDYEFCYAVKTSFSDANQVKLALCDKEGNDVQFFSIVNQKNNDKYILANCSLAKSCSDFQFIQAQIAEVFIDGFIHLSRNDSLSELEAYSFSNDVDLWFNAVTANLAGKRYFDELQKKYETFVISPEVHSTEICDVDNENLVFSYKWSHADQSLFLLFMQYIFNAEKAALYGFYTKNEQSVSRQYTLLQGSEYYADLEKIVTHEQSPATFIDKDYIYSELLFPSVGICEVNDELIDESLLLIQTMDDAHQVKLIYKKNIPLFSVMSHYVEAFLARIDDFKSGTIDWNNFCQLPEALIQHYYLDCNSEQILYPQNTITALFEEQVTLNPDKLALIVGDTELTYDQLNMKANGLAHYLKEHFSVAEGERVAVLLPRDESLLISLLAILKLGCAYVPLDSTSPLLRTQAILNDAKPSLVLTRNDVPEASLPDGITALSITNDLLATIEKYCNPPELLNSGDVNALAYVIYTSGTTGVPKGVAVRHRNFVNVAYDFCHFTHLSPESRMLALTTLAFDISTLELFMPLMFGASVVLAEQRALLDARILKQYLTEFDITHMQATPSFWRQAVAELGQEKFNIIALCGGEAVPLDVAKGLVKMTQKAWNVYGPTETTVWSTAYCLNEITNKVLIGKPLANTQCYVLNHEQKPVAPGVVGELYIAGDGVVQGYFNNPELTAKAFIANPFVHLGSNHSATMYRTGDKVRYLSCGNIEYLSRADFQVKLRGHRIELGDIESAIKHYPGIEQAVVQLQKNQESDVEPFLVAYYTAKEPIGVDHLKDWLKSYLPEYMIPVDFMFLASIPLNINGKVDRKALPAINLVHNNRFIAPETQTQRILCQLFGSALGVNKNNIGLTDDFFALGGNSLSAIKLVNLINTEFRCDIKIKDIFEQKNVSSLTPLVNAGKGDFLYRDFIIKSSDITHQYHPFTLNNVQQTYYFGRFKNFELSNVSTHIYHEYAFGYIDHARLESAFNLLIKRHLSLRTVFENGEQRYLNQVPHYQIRYQEFTNHSELEGIRQAFSHKVYAADVYPLFDILLSKVGDSYILHVSFDAIIIDMKSFEILFSEWIILYQNPQAVLPKLLINYRDYHTQYERIRQSELFHQAEQYWHEKTQQMSLKMDLPLAANPSSIEKPYFKRVTRTVPQATWQLILDKCRCNDISPTALIAELFCRVLCFWSDQEKVTLNLTLFNRLPLHAQVDDIIGDFTVLSLFDYQLRNDISARQQLELVHSRLLEDVDNNLCDGIDVQRMLKQARSLPSHQVVAPVVLTSVIGMNGKASMFDLPLDESYQGTQYAISQTSQVWLDHKAYETDAGFVAEWDYVDQLFSPQTIQAMHDSYCALIEQVAHRDWDLMALPFVKLPDWQKAQITHWNNTQASYPSRTLVELFETSPSLINTSKATAVVDSQLQTSFTYAEIHEAYLSVASALMASGETQGQLIAILAEKGYWHVTATLGIMKAGAAYVPLHPDWPIERLNDILEQSGCHTVVVSKSQHAKLKRESSLLNATVLELETLVQAKGQCEDIVWPSVKPTDLAYVIFTSGSTGRPKGVAISHHGAFNTIEAVNRRFNINASDTVLALSELSFDLSVYDIFGVLGAGGKIVFPCQADCKKPEVWLELVHRHHVTLWNTVPQLAGLVIDEFESRSDISMNIRLFLMSGDWIPLNLPNRIKTLNNKTDVISLGGATEGSIWSIWYPVEQVDPEWTSIPYGTAMPNQTMYVLDNRGEHCAFGVTGEIHIGGDGVALEYWNAPELTKERFINHPELGRLYKTGDLGRWSEQGFIEFLGRTDNQVKLNGYRVELEEIAAHINKLEGISQALVHLQQQETSPALVAYLIPEKEQPVPVYTEDKELFILQQRGIVPVENAGLALSHSLQKDDYLRRKSYRKFDDCGIDSHRVNTLITLRQNRSWSSATGNAATWHDLQRILSVCAGLELPNRVLPKYRYPSAGSTYSVQAYVGLNDKVDATRDGYYYYHPTRHSLYELPDVERPNGVASVNFIDLVINWEAIRPLYHDRAKALALLEAGHMLALLADQCEQLEVGYHAAFFEPDVSATKSLVCRLVLCAPLNQSTQQADTKLSLYNREGAYFCSTTGSNLFDIEQQPVLVKASDVHAIVSGAQGLIHLEGPQSTSNYVYAGWLFQHLSDDLVSHDIGCCMLGLTLSENNLYTMAIGAVREEDKAVSDVHADVQPLNALVRQHLAQSLPDYMIPQHFVLLNELPLSANGKVDASRLPQVTVDTSFQGPVTKLEQQLCEVWAKILKCQPTDIDCAESFFNCGGNSLLAMRLVRRLDQQLGVQLKLEDIYNNSTVIAMAEQAESQMENHERVVGVL